MSGAATAAISMMITFPKCRIPILFWIIFQKEGSAVKKYKAHMNEETGYL